MVNVNVNTQIVNVNVNAHIVNVNAHIVNVNAHIVNANMVQRVIYVFNKAFNITKVEKFQAPQRMSSKIYPYLSSKLINATNGGKFAKPPVINVTKAEKWNCMWVDNNVSYFHLNSSSGQILYV